MRMKFTYRLLLASLLLFISIFPLAASDPDSLLFSDHIFSNKIKTVQLYKEGWNLSYPAIRLGADEKLALNFDLLGNSIETYYYTFVHCDKDWRKSDIFPNDYMEGFTENPIDDYRQSFNTTVNYIHYNLTFPNDRVNLLLSGNYIIMVYPVGEPDKPVLTRRFMITEDLAGININVHRPRMTADLDASQQVDFTVRYSGLNINDPYIDIFAFILQNGRWNNSKRNLKPEFYGNNELNYSALSDKNIFRGGNEFRYFDIRSIRYQSEFVRKIDYLMGNYHIYLSPSENREFKPYFYWQDFNGKYYVAVQEGRNPDTDADYVYVYFTMPSKFIIPDGKLYISGALTDWTYDANSLMTYNPDDGAYECVMLLKQGWYNFEYFFMQDSDNTGVVSKFEGSHFETENDYTVLVYYRNPLGRYDRLIGMQTVNTLNKLSD